MCSMIPIVQNFEKMWICRADVDNFRLFLAILPLEFITKIRYYIGTGIAHVSCNSTGSDLFVVTFS